MRFGAGTERTLMLAAAWIFGVFLVVAAIFRAQDGSQATLAVVAGAFAYAFLAVAAVILVRGWRRRGQDAARAATRFVSAHPAVAAAVGRPVRVGDPEGEIPSGSGAAQANLAVPVAGPADEGRVDLVMARITRDWEVLTATLVVDGDRVRLAEGFAESVGDDA
jgi:hypothetical protein